MCRETSVGGRSPSDTASPRVSSADGSKAYKSEASGGQTSVAIVSERLLNFLACIHHERPVLHDRLAQRLGRQQQEVHSLGAGLHAHAHRRQTKRLQLGAVTALWRPAEPTSALPS